MGGKSSIIFVLFPKSRFDDLLPHVGLIEGKANWFVLTIVIIFLSLYVIFKRRNTL